jgi:putative MATE family efflux protein
VHINHAFTKKFIAVSVPIAAQQFLKSLMYFIDNIMIGALGENAIVGVGNANQIAFFIMVLMFGVCSTGWVFAARYNGEGDAEGVRRTLGISLAGTLLIGGVFFVLTLVLPQGLIGVFNPLPGVMKSGGDYIHIVGVSYIFLAVSQTYANILKGCEKTRLPMITGFVSILVNAFLNYVLIFGKFGFPALGVRGAAIGTVVGGFVDAALLVLISNRKGSALRASFIGLLRKFGHARDFIRQFFKVGTPIILNEFLWALNAMAMIVLYNRMGIAVAAAMTVFSALDRLAYVVYVGIGHSSGVMVGNQLGRGDRDMAYIYGRRFLIMSPVSTVFVGALTLAVLPLFLAQYDIPPDTLEMTKKVVYTAIGVSVLVVTNFTNIIGVLRGGGDTHYAMTIDIIGAWFITVPVAYVSGLVLHWPIYYVYLSAFLLGDAFKFILGIHRFRSKKWMHDITSVIKS